MGAAYFNDIPPFGAFCCKRIGQATKRGQEVIAHRQRRRNVQCAGEAVIRRLAHVDMVIGMHRRFAAACARQRLIGDAGNNLVHIHVRLRAAARLPDDKRELRVIFAD